MLSALIILKAPKKNLLIDNASVEKDIEVTFLLQYYYLLTFLFISSAKVSKHILAEQNKEKESNKKFLWLYNNFSFLNLRVFKILSPDSLNYTRLEFKKVKLYFFTFWSV